MGEFLRISGCGEDVEWGGWCGKLRESDAQRRADAAFRALVMRILSVDGRRNGAQEEESVEVNIGWL